MIKHRKHVLCTGMHRSGTTWLGRALEHAHALRYVHEPSNPAACRKVEYFYFAAETPEALNAPYAFALDPSKLRRLASVASAQPGRVPEHLSVARAEVPTVVKDPFAFFNTKMLQQKFDMDVVLIVRHPVDVVSSILRLNWDFDFAPLLRSERFRQENSAWLDEIGQLPHDDLLAKSALLWVVLHNWWRTSSSAPSDFKLVIHDKISQDPGLVKGILAPRPVAQRELAEFIRTTRRERPEDSGDIPHDDLVRSNADLYKPGTSRLSAEQIDRISTITQAESQAWGLVS